MMILNMEVFERVKEFYKFSNRRMAFSYVSIKFNFDGHEPILFPLNIDQTQRR